MYVKRIELVSAPGIADGLLVEDMSPGLNVVIGKNASGKSTLGRVIRDIVWCLPPHIGIRAHSQWVTAPGKPVVEAHIAFGQVTWDEDPPTAPEQALRAWRLDVRDLLSATDTNIAQLIEQALHGGYDLAAVRESFRPPKRPSRNTTKAIRDARAALTTALNDADALARRERKLETLREARTESAGASRELDRVRKAAELADLRTKLTATREHLRDAPEALDIVPDDIEEQIARHEEDIAAIENELAKLDGQLAEYERDAKAIQFTGKVPSTAEVNTRLSHASELDSGEREAKQANNQVASTRAALEKARSQVVSERSKDVPAPATLEQLETALQNRRAARANEDAKRFALEALPDSAPAGDERELDRAVNVLREWLSAPMPLAPLPRNGRGSWVIAVALLCSGALIVVALVWSLFTFRPDAFVAALLATAPVIGLAGWVAWGPTAEPPPVDNPREGLEASWRYPHTPTWSSDDQVRALLRELEHQLAEAHEHNRLEALRTQAKHVLEAARQQRATADQTVRDAVDELGLNPEFADALLIHQAGRLQELSKAQVEHASSEAARDAIAEANRERLQDLVGWIARVLPDANVRDGASALAAVQQVDKRLRELESIQRSCDSLRDQRAAADVRLRAAKDRRAHAYRRGGVEPGQIDELRLRVQLAPLFREHQQEETQLKRRIQKLESELEGMDSLTRDEAKQRIIELEHIASELELRAAAVSDLEKEIDSAVSGNVAEEARGRREAGENLLAGQRDQAMVGAAGEVLMDWLRDRASRDQTPAVLERARTWFLRFTQMRYRIDVDPIRGFVAHDAFDNRRRGLEELSDATRIQLLLAARLAFVEQAEAGALQLPLFLDEVLSTTDPHRFEAVGSCVLDLVEAGRQVFYATADEAEVRAWFAVCERRGAPEPRVLRLSESHTPRPWPEGAPSAPQLPEPIPDPKGMHPKEYLARVGQSVPGLWDDAATWPVVLVLHDDLETAARCLEHGIRTVGQLRTMQENGLPVPPDSETLDLLTARHELLDETLAALRIGRAKPLTWTAVEASGAVTDSFRERMEELMLAHGDDADMFVSEVSELPRFRRQKAEDLRQHLLDEGLLTEDEPLPPREVRSKVSQCVRPHLDTGTMSVREVDALINWIAALMTGTQGSKP